MATLALPPVPAPRERQVSAYAALTRRVQEAGLMRRRHGYYWTWFLGLTAALGGLVAAMVLLGPSWWQLLVAAGLAVVLGQVMFLGHDAAHRQIFASGRWNDWASLVIANLYAGMSYGWWQHKHSRHHAKPNQIGADPDIATDTIIFHTEDIKTPRTGLRGWLTARQGWLFFPLLLLEGLNLHVSGIRTIFGRGTVKRRPVEIAFVTLRIGGYLALVFWFMPVGLAFAFLGVQLGLFGLYMGAVFAPNHKGMPLVPKDSRIDFMSRQVLMSRNITGGPVDRRGHGWAQPPDRAPPVPLDASPAPAPGSAAGARGVRRAGDPLHRDDGGAVLRHRDPVPQRGRRRGPGPVPVPGDPGAALGPLTVPAPVAGAVG